MFNNNRTDRTLLLIAQILWIIAVAATKDYNGAGTLRSRLSRLGGEIKLLQDKLK